MASIGGSKHHPLISGPALATATSIEDSIRHDAVETGALIARDGSQLARHQGKSDRVTFLSSELNRASGCIFTHNHPKGSGPSIDDVVLGISFDFVAVRVVTVRHRFMVSGFEAVQVQALQSEYGAEEMRVFAVIRDEVRRCIVHPADFGSEIVHRTWLRVSSHLGFTYRRDPP